MACSLLLNASCVEPYLVICALLCGLIVHANIPVVLFGIAIHNRPEVVESQIDRSAVALRIRRSSCLDRLSLASLVDRISHDQSLVDDSIAFIVVVQ